MRTEAVKSERNSPSNLPVIQMPAFARVAVPGIPYHVTQRGNYRQDVFATERDREIYLEYVASAAVEYGLELHGWCLMTNHVHWIVLPKREMAMAQSFRRAHSRFASYVNRQHKRAAGHLWQGRYYSCPLDEEHFGAALLYAERNPLRAGLVRSAVAYRWSSAAARLGLVSAPDYLQTYLWAASFTAQEWASLLEDQCDAKKERTLRASTKQGKPCGNRSFIERIEAEAGWDLCVRAVGRPLLRRAAATEC